MTLKNMNKQIQLDEQKSKTRNN